MKFKEVFKKIKGHDVITLEVIKENSTVCSFGDKIVEFDLNDADDIKFAKKQFKDFMNCDVVDLSVSTCLGKTFVEVSVC